MHALRRSPDGGGAAARTTPRAAASCLILLALFLPLVASAPGCQPLAPGADPVVVSSEQATQVAFEAINLFLEVEHANREEVKLSLPAVHEFAEKCRRTAPGLLRDARSFTKAYKAGGGADAQAGAEKAIAALQELARLARAYIVQIDAARSQTPPA